MDYVPQTWVDGTDGGTPLSAERLNVIEQGIGNLLVAPFIVSGGGDSPFNLLALTVETPDSVSSIFGPPYGGANIQMLVDASFSSSTLVLNADDDGSPEQAVYITAGIVGGSIVLGDGTRNDRITLDGNGGTGLATKSVAGHDANVFSDSYIHAYAPNSGVGLPAPLFSVIGDPDNDGSGLVQFLNNDGTRTLEYNQTTARLGMYDTDDTTLRLALSVFAGGWNGVVQWDSHGKLSSVLGNDLTLLDSNEVITAVLTNGAGGDAPNLTLYLDGGLKAGAELQGRGDGGGVLYLYDLEGNQRAAVNSASGGRLELAGDVSSNLGSSVFASNYWSQADSDSLPVNDFEAFDGAASISLLKQTGGVFGIFPGTTPTGQAAYQTIPTAISLRDVLIGFGFMASS